MIIITKFYNLCHAVYELNMATLECILCTTIIQKKGDVNLVHGKRDVDVGYEIGNLSFIVRPDSQHICRSCLNSIKQRVNLKKKLEDLTNKLLIGYKEKGRAKGFAVKMKESAKRSLNFRDSLSSDTAGPSYFIPNDSSTPSGVRGCAEMPKSSSTIPISPITVVQEISAQPSTSSTHVAEPIAPDDAPTITETIVAVEVQWQCKTKRRIYQLICAHLARCFAVGLLRRLQERHGEMTS